MSKHSSLRSRKTVAQKQTAGQAASAPKKRARRAANGAWWKAEAARMGCTVDLAKAIHFAHNRRHFTASKVFHVSAGYVAEAKKAA